MKPLNIIQIGKKNILTKLKPSNAIKTVLLERSRTQISTTVLFRKNKRFHFFFRNGTAQFVTVVHKRRKTNKVHGDIS